MILKGLLCTICYIGMSVFEALTFDTVPIQEAEAVVGGDVKLPCDLIPPTIHDRVAIVIWYKDDGKSPIYSFDVRGRAFNQGSHWFDERQLSDRAIYTADPPQSHLLLQRVKDSDVGLYKCRVDFKHSPTRNSLVNLTVIVPPRKLTLLDSTGASLQKSIIGPISEGSPLMITCVALGGWPAPKVTWWRDGVMIDDSAENLSEGRVKNSLSIERVKRAYLGSKFSCQATNTPLLAPLVATVTVDIYLGPLDVRLLGENLALSAGSKYEVACQSFGSRPAATISWWRNGKILHSPTRVITSHDSNVTTSTLTLTADVTYDGNVISCRASNPNVPGSALEDNWTLNIHYTPIVTVELGSSLNGSFIREGMDIYFECNIQSNPKPKKLVWKHNGNVVSNNSTTGVIISNQTLVLQSVSRHSNGAYLCVTGNSEGDVESKPFYLDIKYEPKCRPSQQSVYGAARMEEVVVTCEVDANPPAGWFHWSFNNSAAQTKDMEIFESIVSDEDGGKSIAKYTAIGENDFGTLLCWGRNDLGSQIMPCIFHIVPAGVPDSPYNCTVRNRSQTWLHIFCLHGFNGGLPQQFVAEVREEHERLVSNVSSRGHAEFMITSLESGRAYNILVYSSNDKGRSAQSVNFVALTLGHTQHQHRRTQEGDYLPLEPVIWVSSGVAIVILMIVGIIVFLIIFINKKRHRKQLERNDSHLDKSVTPTAAIIDDDRNPDVIPHNNELECVGVVNITSSDLLGDTGLTQWDVTAATLTWPKEAITAERWGISLWPSTITRPVTLPQKNAETQTSQSHKESTV